MAKNCQAIEAILLTEFKSARDPDPERLISAYHHSAATLNYARALVDGGFADLHHPHHWDLGFVRSSANRAAYEDIVDRIRDAIDFVESTGVRGTAALKTVELFCSHEGLLLDYETALTESVGERWYNLGAHFLWIGDRTRQLDGAHVEYFRGLENPIGIKAGPSMAPADLVELITTLEPANRPGRITVITRLGAGRIAEALPPLVQAVQAAGRTITWVCDPMHGNTVSTDTGLKTRDYDAVLAELEGAFAAHEATGSRLGGVHFELTGEDVTECTGGPQELSVADLSRSYETYCDPRLNYAQSLELALRIAQRLQGRQLAASTEAMNAPRLSASSVSPACSASGCCLRGWARPRAIIGNPAPACVLKIREIKPQLPRQSSCISRAILPMARWGIIKYAWRKAFLKCRPAR